MKVIYYYFVWDYEIVEEVLEYVERGSNNGGDVVVWSDCCCYYFVECEVYYWKVYEE